MDGFNNDINKFGGMETGNMPDSSSTGAAPVPEEPAANNVPEGSNGPVENTVPVGSTAENTQQINTTGVENPGQSAEKGIMLTDAYDAKNAADFSKKSADAGSEHARPSDNSQPGMHQPNSWQYTAKGQTEGTNDRYNRNQAYYTENIKKTKPKKIGAWQLILVSVLSSVLGAGMMFAAVIYLAPALSTGASKILGLPESTTETSKSDNGVYKKIEITQSESPVEAVAEKVGPSIVGIQVTVPSKINFFFDLEENGVGYGSGIIIRKDGYILTNNHVIEATLASQMSNKMIDGAKIEVILPSNKDVTYEAKIVGRDERTDIAVLKIDVDNLPVAELGDSDSVKVGELAVAIGNPGGMDYMGSVTAGIISGVDRTITLDNGRELKLIQTDAAINPGNSGGALANSQGQVIGINTIKISATDIEGLGFAIPINEAKDIAESLIDYKYVKDRPYIGVVIDNSFTEDDAKQLNVPAGLLVYEVQPLSAAYKAGIHTGDIITKFDGVKVTKFKELEDQKDKHKPGDEVEVEVYRDGETLKLKLVLGEEKNID